MEEEEEGMEVEEEEEKANRDLQVLSQPLVEAWHKIRSVTL